MRVGEERERGKGREGKGRGGEEKGGAVKKDPMLFSFSIVTFYLEGK